MKNLRKLWPENLRGRGHFGDRWIIFRHVATETGYEMVDWVELAKDMG
jgi:hypothetical protein